MATLKKENCACHKPFPSNHVNTLNFCVLFRFAAFGAGETTSLRIYRQDYATSPKDADDALNVDEDDASPTVFYFSSNQKANSYQPLKSSAS